MDALQLPIKHQSIESFESYLTYVSSLPLLNEQREKELFTRYQQKQDLSAAQEIIMSHLRFVAFIVRSYKGYGLPKEDLFQEGTIGLMKSVKKFDLSYGVRLASFAVHYIKAEIHEFILRNWRMVRCTTTKAKRKLFYNLRKFRSDTNWLQHEDKNKISSELNVEVEDIDALESQIFQPDVFIDSERDAASEEGSAFIEGILEDKKQSFSNALIEQKFAAQIINEVKEIVKTFDERSKDIVNNRWFSEEKKTYKDFSHKYSVSQERIRQIEEKALNTVKQKLKRHHQD